MAERKITPDVRVLPRANSVGTVRKLVPLFELLGHQVKLLDSDGDGSIGISEIFSHVKETAVQGMDLDGDGKVGFTEVMMSLVNIIKDLPNFRQWETKLFHSRRAGGAPPVGQVVSLPHQYVLPLLLRAS